MSVLTESVHEKKVSEWEKQNIKNLSQEQQVQLFIKAITAVEKRSLQTLSKVTLMAILDRVFHEAKENYRILSEVTAEISGSNFDALLNKSKLQKTTELTEALRFLLIRVLEVICNITGEILTTSLHAELMTVTADKQALRSVGSSTSDGEQQ